MKKIFLGVAAMSMILSTSCQNEEMIQQVSVSEYSLTLDMGVSSRTLHNEEGECVWGEKEQLYVVGNGGKVFGTLTMKSKSADGKKAVFSGKVTGDPAKLQFMVYPVPEADGTIPMGNIDGTNHNAPMTGIINPDGRVIADYAGGLVKIPVSGINDLKVNVKNLAGKSITGGCYAFNPATGKLTFDPNAGSSINISNIAQTNGFVYVPVETDADEGTQTETEEVTVEVTVGEGTNQQTQSFETIVQEGAITAKDIPGILIDESGTLAQVDEWDGTIGKLSAADKDGVITINTAEELAALAQAVNAGDNFAEKTIALKRDMNLNGYSWTPIGDYTNGTFKGTFDGNNHKISNLVCIKEGTTGVGLFGKLQGTVKNLKLENVSVLGSKYVGAVAGYVYYGNINNCHVIDAKSVQLTRYQGADDKTVGGVIGALFGGKLTECIAENVIVKGYTAVGGIVGRMQYGGELTNNIINNSIVIQDGTIIGNEKDPKFGEIIGQLSSGTQSDNTADQVYLIHGVSSLSEEYPELFVDENKNYFVYSPNGMLGLSGKSMEGTINFIANIDMNGATLKTIAASYGKKLIVNGNGKSVKNVILADGGHNTVGCVSMFQSYTGSTLSINDLQLEKVTVNSGTYGAAVIGYNEGTTTLDNVDVKDANITAEKSSGVLIGHATAAGDGVTIRNCDVSDSTVKTTKISNSTNAPYPAGAYVGRKQNIVIIENCTNNTNLPDICEDLIK